MFHFFGVVRRDYGPALANWQVGLVDSLGAVVDIFSDENSTPIATVSGVANRAVSDASGNYSLFVPNGTYDVQFFNSSGVFQRTVRAVPMYGSEVTALPRGGVGDLAIRFLDDPNTGIYSSGPDSIEIYTGADSGYGIRLEPGAGSGVSLDLSEVGAVVAANASTGSATFEVNSKVGGILFPRMTTTQRNAMISPADGLVIYNSTTAKLQVRAGGAWVDLH